MIESKSVNFIFLLIVLLVFSCADNKHSYFPLDNNYKWQYDVALITSDGLSNQKYIFNNLGKTELNGESVFSQQSLDGTMSYYSSTEDGIHYLGNVNKQELNSEFKAYNQLILPNDLIIGSEWEEVTITRLLQKTGPPQKTELKIITKVPLSVKIESINDTVIVPAGKFENCVKLSMSGSVFKNAGNYIGLTIVNVEQSIWYAPSVGLVKLERVETTKHKALDKGSLLVELTDFKSG